MAMPIMNARRVSHGSKDHGNSLGQVLAQVVGIPYFSFA
jgi:hypothetical protein